MKTIALGEISKINPRHKGGTNGDPYCSFIPMDYVDEQFGVIAKTDVRAVVDVVKGYTAFREGDVLFAKITPCMENGKCAIARGLKNGIGFGSTEFHVIRPNGKILPEWIFYFLRQESTRANAERQMRGSAGQQRVPKDFLENVQIPLPPLEEQRRIAAVLAKADRLRQMRRYALQLSDSYLQAVFLRMFGDPVMNPMGWEKGRLKELCERVVDCPHSTPAYAARQTPYACVRSSDIQNGFFDWSTTKYVDSEEYKSRIVRAVPMPGDVVYCREGARFGNAARIPAGRTVCLGQRTMLFRAKAGKATPEFIWAYLETKSTYQQAVRLSGGSASPHVNVQDIKAFTVTIPPLSLQEEFSCIVRRFERLRTQQLEAARQADHLFDTLLHRAFRGDL